MWCGVYTGEGRETGMEVLLRRLLPGTSYTRCFHLVQHRVMKLRGCLWDVPRNYFPGYVFIETEEPQVIHEALRKAAKTLLSGDGLHVSVLDREEESLFRLVSDEKGEIELSVARVSMDEESGRRKAEYLSGPLSRVAHKVTAINYHKRFAEIGVEFPKSAGGLKLNFYYDGEEVVGRAAAGKGLSRPT